MRRGIRKIVGLVLFILIAALVVLAVFYRTTIRDFVRGIGYQPTTEMAEIKKRLDLTDYGDFIFSASRPELNEKDDFNQKCRVVSVETAVLGCYANENIYIYNIKEQKLDGIRELTAAHELLHAIYTRLSQNEKTNLEPILRQVYQENLTILNKDIAQYSEGEQLEEIYVRVGTEVKNLPEELENHYAGIFSDQDAVVGLYEKYIGVFRELEAKMDALKVEMDSIKLNLDNKTYDYENRAQVLRLRIEEFNGCANTEGCFGSAWEFYAERNQLLIEQDNLAKIYNEINTLISQYNEKVNEYNNNVIQNNQLNQIINSNQRIEALE